MKSYIYTKVIHAVPVTLVDGVPWPEGLPIPDGYADEACSYTPNVQASYMYMDKPEDRYPNMMSTEEFRKYCRSTENMDFGDALAIVKSGGRVARRGWNGKGQYVFLASDVEFHTDADISAFDDKDVEVGDMLVLKTAQGTLQPGWLASQSDMLAEDWYIVT